jgi:hypothetical protein
MSACHQIDDIVKMKRNKMKKIVALVAVLFSVVVPVQSQASAVERIVIIDDYFNRSLITGSVEFVCVASDRCVNNAANSHGTQMALIARQQNPNATLVLVQASAVSKTGSIGSVNLKNLVDSLNWASANTSNVSAVSFSRFMNHSSKVCMPPASAPFTPETGFAAVNSQVSNLKSKGIPVVAASGNHNNRIDFPACIPDVISVGAIGMGLGNGFHGETSSFPADTILSSQTVRNTTSSATVIVAARYKTLNLTTSKVVSIP